ncbi:MAG: ATPase [Lachnospiraceae bacterium]|nr:ATPase [Lachnospiraceae bacterium]
MNLEKTVIGIEFGSTRIKAVMLDEEYKPVASGSFDWENKFEGGYWTYSQEEIFKGIQDCYKELKKDVKDKFGFTLTTTGAIGISGMMHGYLVFDKDGNQMEEFRTWRNTTTGEAAEKLSGLFGFNIPQRWSVAHLYQAMLNGEGTVQKIDRITTLAGFIHFKLSGEHVMGIGEASGMFPIDSTVMDYDEGMIQIFDGLAAEMGMPWKMRDIFPKAVMAGAYAGKLTVEGAAFLDPEGDLQAGIPLAPCEGDAGTGMVATNSVRVRTGNVSAGTSDFAMLVTDKKLGVHREIDMVTTPDGNPVAMVHCNNCTSDINAWVGLFDEFAEYFGVKIDKNDLYTKLFQKALEGAKDCGGLMNYNYFSGEGVTNLDEGRPVFARMQNCDFSLANFMRVQLMSSLATLKIGLDILVGEEGVTVDKLYGHGGFFKTPVVGQKMLSAAIAAPVSVMETAGEGGPYGMALLCAYMLDKDGMNLADFLDNKVFAGAPSETIMADEDDVEGFAKFLEGYKSGLEIEKAAIKTLQ